MKLDMANPLQTIKLRPASMADADILLMWRNDPSTRKASITGQEITLEMHKAWLTKLLADNNRKLYIGEVQGHPVGTVRADKQNKHWELSWTVSPGQRGKGIGKKMVSLLADTIGDTVTAKIKNENLSSVRIAEHAGMILQKKESGILFFRRGPLQQK